MIGAIHKFVRTHSLITIKPRFELCRPTCNMSASTAYDNYHEIEMKRISKLTGSHGENILTLSRIAETMELLSFTAKSS